MDRGGMGNIKGSRMRGLRREAVETGIEGRE